MSKVAEASSSGANGAAGGQSSAAEPTVSRYAGQPGTLTALRVDYTAKDRAFGSHAPSTKLGAIRDEVKQLSSGPRLGDKPLWNTSNSTAKGTGYGSSGPIGSVHFAPPDSSVVSSVPGLPQRPLMSQNSAYQAVKLEYNYRAEALPPVKEVLYIPKHNKLEVDKTVFLTSGIGKGTTTVITNKCLTTATTISRAEHQNNFAGKKSGVVNPLTDTFGDHNVRRHMTVTGPANTRGGANSGRRGKGGDGGIDGADASGLSDDVASLLNGTLGAAGDQQQQQQASQYGCPVTLRDRGDVDVMHFATKGQVDAYVKKRREAGWNVSNALPDERTNIYKLREYKDYRGINKRKEGTMFLRGLGGGGNGADGVDGPDPNNTTSTYAAGGGVSTSNPTDGDGAGGLGMHTITDPDVPIAIDVAGEMAAAKVATAARKARICGVYTTPFERQQQISAGKRSEKLDRRAKEEEAAERAAIDQATLGGVGSGRSGTRKGGTLLSRGGERVFKMSNREEWWSALPPDVERCRAELAAAHVRGTDTFNNAEGQHGDVSPNSAANALAAANGGAPPSSRRFAPQLDDGGESTDSD